MSFSLTILGSSSALPTSKRFPTAQVVNLLEQFFLIDCGEGTQIQIRSSKIKLGKLNHIFISHLHGDHYFGIFGLISTLGLLGRTSDLYIYSFPELKQMINFQFKYYDNKLPFRIIYHYLDSKNHQVIYENEKLQIESFPLKHRIPTCGFVFREKQKLSNIKKEMVDKYQISIREIVKIKEGADYILSDGTIIKNEDITISPPKPHSYAFCSDTIYREAIIPYIKDVDLLYHEATFGKDQQNRAKKTFHSTASQAAQIALLANVKQLIIGHFSVRYKDINILLKEAKVIFENTLAAEDGKTYQIK